MDIRATCPFLIMNPFNVGKCFLWLTFRLKQRGVERGLLGRPIWPLLIFREDEHMTARSLYKSTDLAAILASLCSAKELKSLKQKGREGNEWSNIGQHLLWPAVSHVLIILKNTQGMRRTTMSNMFTQPYFLLLLHFLRKGESWGSFTPSVLWTSALGTIHLGTKQEFHTFHLFFFFFMSFSFAPPTGTSCI